MNRDRGARDAVLSRLAAACALAVTIACGLGVRALLTGWWAKYLGVGLWAVAAYCGVRLIRPAAGVRATACAALVISWGVELAQLTPGPRTVSSWHPVLRLFFGEVFSPKDLLALGVGILFSAGIDAATRRPRDR